jgi:hypothetical protein
MVSIGTSGYTLEGLNLQGCRVAGAGAEPTGGVYPNRAKVGIHILPSAEGSNTNTAKSKLDNLTFWQLKTGILVGTNLDDIGAASYTGQDANHGDSIDAGVLRFIYPASGIHANEAGSACVHIRNDQSVGHYFKAIHCSGHPEQVFYLERGGKTHVGLIHTSGGGWCVRTGIIGVDQGGLTVGHAAIDAGSSGKLLKGDAQNSSLATPYCEIQSASIPVGNTTIPQVDVGSGTWVIRNCNYLKAGSIKMTGGLASGTSKRICHVHLENVGIVDTNIAGLIDGTSSGMYLLTWKNCWRYHDGNATVGQRVYGQPFLDSDASNEIKSGWNAGSPNRLPIDFTP